MRGFAASVLVLSLVAGPVLATESAPAASQDATKGGKAAPTKKPGTKRHARHHASAKPATTKPESAQK